MSISTAVDASNYIAFWKVAFSTIFVGIWPKILGVICLFMFWWFGFRSKKFGAAMIWLFFAAMLAYGSSLLLIFGFKGGH